VAPNRSFFDEVVLPANVQLNPTLTYENRYGTNLSGSYNLGTGQLEGSVTVPIGAAENGNLLTIEGGYGPEGPSAFLGFKKKNRDRLKEIREAEDEYSLGLDLFGGGMQRPAGQAMGIPAGAMPSVTGMGAKLGGGI